MMNKFEESIKPTPIEFVYLSKIDVKLEDVLIETEGILKSFTQITPKITKTYYVCIDCGAIVYEKEKKCSICNGFFKKYSEKIDLISGILEEESTGLDIGRVPASILLEFNDNTKEIFSDLSIGMKYRIKGRLLITERNKKSVFVLKVISYEKRAEGIECINLSSEDIEKIKNYSAREDLFENLRENVFNTDLFNLKVPMDSILLMMVSAPKTYINKEVLKNRGNIMVLLVGSPGKAKSQLLKRAVGFFPKSRYATCSNASAIGLVASVQKDDRIGDYVLSPGTVALCNPHGISAIDEIDKIDKFDLTKLNTMMDSLFIQVDKANIHRKIYADVSILAAMNPKYGSFDDNETPYSQINLRKDFLDRFDLIFNLDYFNTSSDNSNIANSSLSAYLPSGDKETLDKNFFIKYFSYCRRINPILGQGVLEHINKEFQRLLGGTNKENNMYYSIRLLDNLVRLTCAYSRLRLSTQPDFVDVKNAINIMIESFKSLGIYSDTSGLNQFKTEAVIDYSSRDKMRLITNLLKSSKEGLSYDGLASQVSFDNLDEILDLLKRNGQIYEPKSGIYRIL